MTKQRKEIQKKSDRPSQKTKQSEMIDNDELYQDELANETKESNGIKVTLKQLKKKYKEKQERYELMYNEATQRNERILLHIHLERSLYCV